MTEDGEQRVASCAEMVPRENDPGLASSSEALLSRARNAEIRAEVAEQRVSELEEAQNRWKALIEARDVEIDRTNQLLREASLKSRNATARIIDLERDLNELKQIHEVASRSLSAAQIELADAVEIQHRHDAETRLLVGTIQDLNSQFEQREQEILQIKASLHDVEVRAWLSGEEVAKWRDRCSATEDALEHERNGQQRQAYAIADLENNLRQRREEISQAWAQLAEEELRHGEARKQTEAVRSEKEKAEALGLKLSEEIGAIKAENSRLDSELTDLRVLRNEQELQVSDYSEIKRMGLRSEVRVDELLGLVATTTSRLTEMYSAIDERNRQHETLLNKFRDEVSLHHHTRALLGAAEHARQAASRESFDHFAAQTEGALVSQQLFDLGRELECAKSDGDWLTKVNLLMTKTPAWWIAMPKEWRRRRLATRLMRKDLFDTEAYLDRYPDVAASGIEPIYHYLRHGRGEGRLR